MEEGSLKILAQHSKLISFQCRAGFSQENRNCISFPQIFHQQTIEGGAQGC
jgi:hypothetical protein